MKPFYYEPAFTLGADDIEYRLLDIAGVLVETFRGESALVVEPTVLEQLARAAFHDVSFYLRRAHLEQVAAILKDGDASVNDRFVAAALLKNAVIAAEEVLPSCQDTGTATVVAWKGERVFTGCDDCAALSKGIWDTYTTDNLRYSQICPLTLYDEVNSGTNLPAQIDIFAKPGDAYEFLFVAKGGGSANKTMLYQETKALLNEAALTAFLKEKLRSIGVAACPPYHLALVIGGTSPEMNLKTVKLASAGYLDSLPSSGNEHGRGWRDRAFEATVLEIARELGLGAQFGGRHFAHDVRVIRLPRHAGSCPVGIGVSCSADRNIRGRITKDGVFLEQLDTNPARFLPLVESMETAAPVAVNLEKPMDEIRKQLSACQPGTLLHLSGTLIVARDIAHARIQAMLDAGEPMPTYFKNHPVYYAGPAKTPPGLASGSFGPTTAQRMDGYVDGFMRAGGSLVMLAKGNRAQAVTDACKAHGGFYLGTIGGAAALVAEENITASEIVDFEDLGMEAVRKITVENLPAFVLCDDKGGSLYG